jgi:nucleolar GTP-binding protein
MNFQNIPPVETSKTYLELAFSKARKKSTLKTWNLKSIDATKRKEGIKLDVVKDDLVTRLRKILADFPDFEHLPEFYHVLMRLTIDYGALKKSLGAVSWAVDKICFFQKNYIRKINRAQEYNQVKAYSKEFYGRISSIVKQINSNLRYLEECRRIMKTYPDIKELPTVCIYGFPNIGKTTLLNKVTGSKAKTASYSFTTVSINCAYFNTNDTKIQVLDVPGTLARKEKMNLIELQADLVLKDLADLVIYIFDMTEPYPLKDQIKLYKKVKSIKPTLVYLGKQDLLTEEQTAEFKKLNVKEYSIDQLKKEVVKKLG